MFPQAWLEMSCFLCQQQESGESGTPDEICTQCNCVAHRSCLTQYFVRRRKCPICHADIRAERRLEAANCALDSALLEHGAAHESAIMRKIDVAIALSHCGLHQEKKRLLQPVVGLNATARTGWLILVARLELARACLAVAEYEETRRVLQPLFKQLKGSRDRFIALLLAEGQWLE